MASAEEIISGLLVCKDDIEGYQARHATLMDELDSIMGRYGVLKDEVEGTLHRIRAINAGQSQTLTNVEDMVGNVVNCDERMREQTEIAKEETETSVNELVSSGQLIDMYIAIVSQ